MMQCAVAEICRLVEGLPLGIELVATWLGRRTPAKIVANIQAILDSLAATSRAAPERERSLREVFLGSWALLNSQEQAMLASISG